MNPEVIHYLNLFLGAGAIALQVFALLALLFLVFKKGNIFLRFIRENFLIIGFLISLASSLFSLVYSDIIGFLPCAFCWYQRIFMFPLPFIFGAALLSKDRKIIKYTLPLVIVGFVLSVYQNFIYYFGDSSELPCDASGVSCYQKLVSEFGGYISIPMLAFSGFFALLVLLVVAYFYKAED